MTERIAFRCNNCGKRFDAEVLDENERREARRKDEPTSPIRCPSCGRIDVRHGWD